MIFETAQLPPSPQTFNEQPVIVGSPAHVALLESRIKTLEAQLRALMGRFYDDGK